MRNTIRRAAKESGLTNREIARRAGVNEIDVRRLLGDDRDVAGETAIQIAAALSLSVVDALGVHPRGKLSEAIASRAKRQNLGPAVLAAKADCDKSTVSRYLRGKQDCASELAGRMMETLGMRLIG